MKRTQRRVLGQLAGVGLLGFGLVLSAAPGADAHSPGPLTPGGALPGLSHKLQNEFSTGQNEFEHEFTLAEGLGPTYNDKSCLNCHGTAGGIAGAGDTEGVGSPHNTIHIGLDNQGYYDPLRYEGGPLLDTVSINEDGASCSLGAATIPANANIVSHRHTPPVFGFGLIDAIPDAEILRRVNLGVDGVHGFANWQNEMQAIDTPTAFFPPDQIFGYPRVGRFGWKAQTATLQQFSAEPFNGELGVSTPFFPQEHTPQGVKFPADLPAGCDPATTDPNDPDTSKAFDLYHFQALLAPPPRAYPSRESLFGEALFDRTGCDTCHVPEMHTGPRYYMMNADGSSDRVPQLENQTVHAWSDFFDHDMGADLADDGGTTVGRVMGRARGQHWRTTPLWGLRFKDAYLHDGRTTSVHEAIMAHGGEGQRARDRYAHLSPTEQQAIVSFLRTL
ncbi:MAG TPA: di-heme oxidoredictase family protein [Polyangiaceae bacterium]